MSNIENLSDNELREIKAQKSPAKAGVQSQSRCRFAGSVNSQILLESLILAQNER